MLSRLLGILGAVLIIVGAAGLFVQWREAPTVPAAEATAASIGEAELAAPLPTDPAVTVGTLDNGLRYYLRRNPEPAGRAELRLFVNAGSILEDDDQRGVAHFVEHMAFNGTANFPGLALGRFLQSLGMRFGPSINATTSFDETTYALQIPTDRPEVIDRALLVLDDWADRVTFDAGEVDRERGVIVEEWRQRRGARTRLTDLQLPVLLAGSRYAERMPIGTPESIRTVALARIRQFYADWYRPDLMAIVAVGDFDVAAMEARVRERFAAMPVPAAPRPRPTFDVPALPGTRFAIATDPEATAATVTLRTRTPAEQFSTVGGYRRLLLDRLVAGMISARLTEAAQVPGSSLRQAIAARGPFVRAADAVSLSAVARDHDVASALRGLALESARLTRFGLTEGELDRQKTLTLRAIDRVMTQRETFPSAQLAAEYGRHFLIAEPFPGLEAEAELTRRLLPTIALDEVNQLMQRWLGEGDRVVAITAPASAGIGPADDARLAAILEDASTTTVTPYVFRSTDQPLLETPPSPGSIARTTTRAHGITELTLSNGATVVLYPTTLKEDEVVFTALSPGGTSLAPAEDLIPAVSAAQVVQTMGFGRFASADLQRALTGKIVSVRPVIGLYEAGLAGGGSPRDLEALFELIHLMFTSPRADPSIFSVLQSSIRSAAATQASSPEIAFRRALAAALSQNHPYATVSLESAVDRMDMDRSLRFYRERFADASGFTFVFVGDFEVETITPLVSRLLASLPSAGRAERWRDVGIQPPPGVVERTVSRGSEPAGRVALVFTGPFADSRADATTLTFVTQILERRLRETLREQLSATYNVTVGARVSAIPRHEYAVSIEFGGDPARLDPLVTRVLGEVARLRADGPTDQEMADVQATLLRDVETQSRQNAYWLAQILQKYQRGESMDTLRDRPDLVRAVSGAAVRQMASATLDSSRYVRVTLVPERR